LLILSAQANEQAGNRGHQVTYTTTYSDAMKERGRRKSNEVAVFSAVVVASACSLVRRAFVVGRSWCARGCEGKRVETRKRRAHLRAGSYFFTCEKCERKKILAGGGGAGCWVRERVKREGTTRRRSWKKRLGAGKCGRDTSWQVSQAPPLCTAAAAVAVAIAPCERRGPRRRPDAKF